MSCTVTLRRTVRNESFSLYRNTTSPARVGKTAREKADGMLAGDKIPWNRPFFSQIARILSTAFPLLPGLPGMGFLVRPIFWRLCGCFFTNARPGRNRKRHGPPRDKACFMAIIYVNLVICVYCQNDRDVGFRREGRSPQAQEAHPVHTPRLAGALAAAVAGRTRQASPHTRTVAVPCGRRQAGPRVHAERNCAGECLRPTSPTPDRERKRYDEQAAAGEKIHFRIDGRCRSYPCHHGNAG